MASSESSDSACHDPEAVIPVELSASSFRLSFIFHADAQTTKAQIIADHLQAGVPIASGPHGLHGS